MNDPYGAVFHLYTIRLDGTGLTQVNASLQATLVDGPRLVVSSRQITTEGSFNSFPMFSFDGSRATQQSSRFVYAALLRRQSHQLVQ